MKASKVDLPEQPGHEREALLLAAATAWPRFDWIDVPCDPHGGHDARVWVTRDAFGVGELDDWLRITVSMTTAQQIADHHGAVLATARLSDLVYRHATVRLTPCIQTPDAQMTWTSRMWRHHREVEAQREGRTGLVSTVGKDWVITNKLVGRPDRSANYGWHDSREPGSRPWQPVGLAHTRTYTDYSQVLRLVRREMEVDGQPRDIVDVLADPELAALVSGEGPIRQWRLAGVPEGGTPAVSPASAPDPLAAVPRTLRRGMSGPDVAAWQRFLGIEDDGEFGPNTEAATRRWQQINGLQADGIVGSMTLAEARESGTPTTPVSVSAVSSGSPYKFVQARNFRSATKRKVDLVVIHTMEAAEKPTTAENVAAWFAGPQAPMASAHYCIDSDSIVQCVLEKDVAYHAPGANKNGIGLEHAGYAAQSPEDWADEFSTLMLRRSARLTADLCRRYDIPVVLVDAAALKAGGARGITTHDAVTRAFGQSTHTDPGPHFPMAEYLAWVRELG